MSWECTRINANGLHHDVWTMCFGRVEFWRLLITVGVLCPFAHLGMDTTLPLSAGRTVQHVLVCDLRFLLLYSILFLVEACHMLVHNMFAWLEVRMPGKLQQLCSRSMAAGMQADSLLAVYAFLGPHASSLNSFGLSSRRIASAILAMRIHRKFIDACCLSWVFILRRLLRLRNCAYLV